MSEDLVNVELSAALTDIDECIATLNKARGLLSEVPDGLCGADLGIVVNEAVLAMGFVLGPLHTATSHAMQAVMQAFGDDKQGVRDWSLATMQRATELMGALRRGEQIPANPLHRDTK